MAKETIEIMGKVFNYNGEMTDVPSVNCRGLYSCYDRPSSTKVAIWEEWLRYFYQFDKVRYGVRSYNCMMFTIYAKFIHNGKCYYVEIYPTHNECWLLA